MPSLGLGTPRESQGLQAAYVVLHVAFMLPGATGIKLNASEINGIQMRQNVQKSRLNGLLAV
jgi:hypothetical protein